MSEKNGGPAFPYCQETNNLQVGNTIMFSEPGMSLRDWFAGLAMQGMLSRSGSYVTRIVAENAYAMADAMLEKRES